MARGDPKQRDRRTVGFASVLLPKIWVVLAFVAWAAWLVPQIRKVNRQFQPILPED